MRRWLMLVLLVFATPAHSEPLDNPYGGCDRQTRDTAVALERLGDREALRDHLRSFGCRLIWPREGLNPSSRLSQRRILWQKYARVLPPALRRPLGRRLSVRTSIAEQTESRKCAHQGTAAGDWSAPTRQRQPHEALLSERPEHHQRARASQDRSEHDQHARASPGRSEHCEHHQP